MKLIHHFPLADRCSAISSKAGLHHALTVPWEDKHHNSKCPSLPSSSPHFICWAWHCMVWSVPLVSGGQLFQLHPLPTSCTPPTSLLVGWGEKQKSPWLSVSTAQQWLNHPCDINTVFNTNVKHSPILATAKKMNSIAAKCSTTFSS